jgi:hypothetical protein
MEKLTGDTAQQLPGKRLYVMSGKGCEIVVLQEIIHTHPKQLRYNAYMVAVVKPL